MSLPVYPISATDYARYNVPPFVAESFNAAFDAVSDLSLRQIAAFDTAPVFIAAAFADWSLIGEVTLDGLNYLYVLRRGSAWLTLAPAYMSSVERDRTRRPDGVVLLEEVWPHLRFMDRLDWLFNEMSVMEAVAGHDLVEFITHACAQADRGELDPEMAAVVQWACNRARAALSEEEQQQVDVLLALRNLPRLSDLFDVEDETANEMVVQIDVAMRTPRSVPA